MNIRTQLTLRYIGIVLLVLFAMYLYLSAMLKDSMSTRITRELETQAALTAEFLIEKLPTQNNFTYHAIDSLVDRLGKTSDARLTFIGADGTVWGDTERDSTALRAMDSHLTRPEVQDALQFGSGIRDRYSDTTQTEFRYYAMPIYRDASPQASSDEKKTLIGICRVAMPMEIVNTAISNLRQILLFASVAGLILTIVFSVFSTKIITKPIEKLTQMTQSVAAGNIDSRVPVDSKNELGQLSQNFNLMTDRVQEQIDKISEEHRRLETILTDMGEGVLLVNGAFEITYANSMAISMLSLPDVYVGKALIEINRIPELQTLLQAAEQTETVAFAEIRLGNLTEPEAEVTVVPVSTGEEYVIVIHDVTKERQLERIRADFVANVSHELRTPLTTIQGYAETLLNEDTPRSKTSEQFIVKILNHSSRLSRLISELLELSRLESGDVELKRTRCHLNTFHEPILEVFEPLLEESALVLKWEIPENLPEVSVDQQLFMQVLVNLIDNAIKYTPDSGIITVSAEINTSETFEGINIASKEIIMCVQDTGIGIPMESQQRVFERFYRVDQGRAREMGGTGLGLAITKHIVLRHNGRIWLESSLGKGSVFHVAIPL
ncbi:HAMP domain-containing protein [Candidatus Poribacteria bacterium]|nr:HAMP domain-containing protein [Candidatus Poribacteria bacterium]